VRRCMRHGTSPGSRLQRVAACLPGVTSGGSWQKARRSQLRSQLRYCRAAAHRIPSFATTAVGRHRPCHYMKMHSVLRRSEHDPELQEKRHSRPGGAPAQDRKVAQFFGLLFFIMAIMSAAMGSSMNTNRLQIPMVHGSPATDVDEHVSCVVYCAFKWKRRRRVSQ